MAIDTAAKRQSAFIDVWAVVIPDGSIDSADRVTLVGQYGGLPITAQARLTEELVEVAFRDGSQLAADTARLTEEFVEVAFRDTSDLAADNARSTQEFTEIAYKDPLSPGPAQITEELISTLYRDPDLQSFYSRVTQQSVEVLYLLPTSSDPFDDCGNYTGTREWDIRIFDAMDPSAGKRKTFGADAEDIGGMIGQVNFEIQERGGYGGGGIEFLAPWDDVSLAGTERVDVWLWGAPAYRGYLRIAEKVVGNPETARPQLYGLIAILDQWQVKKKYAYGCDTDIASIFRDIAEDHVAITGRLPNISIESSTPLGVTLKEYDGRGKSVAQAFNDLADISPNACIWGVRMDDATPVPGDVLYFSPRPTTTAYVIPVGDNVQAFAYPLDTHDLVNSLTPLEGGTVKQPNLMPNGSFEEVKPASEDAGNYLLNESFESDATTHESWTASGPDPTVKYSGHPTAHGAARTGHQWAELDEPLEGFSQTVSIVPQLVYEASCWARLEDSNNPNTGVLTLDGLNASNAVVVTTYTNLTGLTAIWKRFTASLDLTSYATVTKLRIKVNSNSGSAADDGVLIDDCGIYRQCAAAQDFWRYTQTGNAIVETLDWDYTGPVVPRTGQYLVHLQCSGVTTTSDSAQIYIYQSKSPSVNPNERYTLIAWYHTNGAGTVGANILRLCAQSVDSSNNTGTVWRSDYAVVPAAGGPSTWQMISLEVVTESTTARLRPYVEVNTNEHVYLDDLMLVQGEVPDEVSDSGGFWTSDTYQRYIDVTDSLLTNLDSGVSTSIDTYGEHEARDTNSLVTDLDTALAYAKGTFNAKALPKVQARLDIFAARKLIAQEGKVRLVNLPSPPDPLWPSRVSYSITAEAIICSAELGNQRPDLSQLLTLTAERAKLGIT